ncbi:MAG: isoprenylcysteine carboxylmethyltransferase family protein [Candidatus Paceibacterota bacterium]|jgi:protein-S-isoprenylcysteine O-methyltransferase Ste14
MKPIEYQENEFKLKRKETVHFVLLHSYSIFLIAVVLGVFLDIVFKLKIFSNEIYKYVGFAMLIISSLIIYWAQSTSANYQERVHKKEGRSNFEFGPYRYMRSPTHFGLFIMTIGFALIINSLFSVIFTIIAYAITKLFFLKREEKILEKKYGEVYRDYKKKVRNWI